MNGPGAEVPRFLVNMGPTGARGILKGRSYVVMPDNGPGNTAAWQTNPENSFSHKSCLGYLVYKWFPERPGAATGKNSIDLTSRPPAKTWPTAMPAR